MTANVWRDTPDMPWFWEIWADDAGPDDRAIIGGLADTEAEANAQAEGELSRLEARRQ